MNDVATLQRVAKELRQEANGYEFESRAFTALVVMARHFGMEAGECGAWDPTHTIACEKQAGHGGQHKAVSDGEDATWEDVR